MSYTQSSLFYLKTANVGHQFAPDSYRDWTLNFGIYLFFDTCYLLFSANDQRKSVWNKHEY